MPDGTDAASDAADVEDVVRTRRLEIVDEAGTVRVVAGRLDGDNADGRPIYGLALVDDEGRPRVWATVGGTGPSLIFDLFGNNVISLGVNDATADALHVGAYLHFTDKEGTPVLGWRVEEDGTVLSRMGGPTP